MAVETCDVAIIGAGTAGLAAERSARRQGAETRLIDPVFAGTTCATVGCMPSKLLIAAADRAHNVNTSDEFGIHAGPVTVDTEDVMRRVRRLRDDFVDSTKESISSLPEQVRVNGRAVFERPTILNVEGRRIEARSVVIATGALPVIPEPFRAVSDFVLTNENIFELERLPDSIAVIGAGSIGLELSQSLLRLGVEVIVFDSGKTISPVKDKVVDAVMQEVFSAELQIITGVDVDAQSAGDKVRITWSGESQGTRTFDRVLVSAGRKPNLGGLELRRTGLDVSDDDVPDFDDSTLQCGGVPIFICGDANGDRPVLHEASHEGTIAGFNAATYPSLRKFKRKVPLQIMFTKPNFASVGDIPEEDDDRFVVGQASFSNQGRARVIAEAEGIVRLFARRQDNALTGALLFGPHAEHYAHLLCWAIGQGMKADALVDQPFYHPTLEEGLTDALSELCCALSGAVPEDRDLGDLPGDQ